MGLKQTLDMLPALPDYSADWDPHQEWYEYGLCDHGGCGVIGYGGLKVAVEEAYYFMFQQFRRFGVKPPEEDLLEWCWSFAFQCIDQVDPYLLFYGCTDVIKTNKTDFNQFSVKEDEQDPWCECNHGSAEHFEYFSNGEQAWEILMERPGLQEYFDTIDDYFSDHISWYTSDEGAAFRDSDEHILMAKYGEQTVDLMHLGIWAAVMWMAGPMPESKHWRNKHHPIFSLCYEGGEAFLHEWRFYPTELFKMEERPAHSCAFCAVTHDCVELVQLKNDGVKFVCQSCQSDGRPFPGMICGTTMCTRVECTNHPAHTTDLVLANDPLSKFKASRTKRMLEADIRYGEIRDVGHGVKTRDLPGMVYINNKMIEHYSNSITSDVGRVLDALLSPPK